MLNKRELNNEVRELNRQVRRLRAQMAALNAPNVWIDGDGSVVYYPAKKTTKKQIKGGMYTGCYQLTETKPIIIE